MTHFQLEEEDVAPDEEEDGLDAFSSMLFALEKVFTLLDVYLSPAFPLPQTDTTTRAPALSINQRQTKSIDANTGNAAVPAGLTVAHNDRQIVSGIDSPEMDVMCDSQPNGGSQPKDGTRHQGRKQKNRCIAFIF